MAATRRTVLICDDEAMLRELIRVSLDASYRFVEAASVAEAHEALSVARPDVVLIDLMLPGGSGLDVLRAVRRADPESRVRTIVISAWTTSDYRTAAAEAGADAFLAKPFLPDELRDLVERLVARG